MLEEDNYWIDYETVDRRKLLTPPEYYFDLSKLEKYSFEEPEKIPEGLREVVQKDIREFFDQRWSVKRNLVHIASLAKLFNWEITDLVSKMKPYENKLLKHPRKRIKRRIQERVMKNFSGK